MGDTKKNIILTIYTVLLCGFIIVAHIMLFGGCTTKDVPEPTPTVEPSPTPTPHPDLKNHYATRELIDGYENMSEQQIQDWLDIFDYGYEIGYDEGYGKGYEDGENEYDYYDDYRDSDNDRYVFGY